jgi:hypothetical protein
MSLLLEHLLRRPRLALLGLGVLLLAPSLLFGVGPSADLEVHYVWARDFPAALFSGELYPRWLDQAMYGLGSPAFYFYPPLTYYVCAPFSLLGLSPTYVIAFTSLVFLVGSGLAMHAWLGRLKLPPVLALAGAALFMAAPYHVLTDHYYRGALAEFAAYLFIPLIAIAIADVRASARLAEPKLALAYAGLLYCHMPSALMVSLLMIPAYVAFLAFTCPNWRERLSFLARAAFAGAGGLALAAPYLAPALGLQSYITPSSWDIDPQTYLPLRPDLWRDHRVVFFSGLSSLVLGWLALAVGVAWLARRAAPSRLRDEALFWGAFASFCAALVLGVVPQFWSLPLIERVQFPMRLMPVVEFASATAFVMALHLFPQRALGRVAAGACLVGLAGVVVFGGYALRSVRQTFTTLPGWAAVQNVRMFDASEYLPAGFFQVGVNWYERPLAAARALPLAASAMPGAVVHGAPAGRAAIRIDADPHAGGRVILRRFYFPSWVAQRQSDGAVLPTAPYGDLRLVSFEAAPGETYILRRTMLPVERSAWLAFAAAVATLLAWAAVATLLRSRFKRAPAAAGAASTA